MIICIRTFNATVSDVVLSTAGISSKEATGRMSKEGDLQRCSSQLIYYSKKMEMIM